MAKHGIRGSYFKDTTGIWNFQVGSGCFLYEGLEHAFHFFKNGTTDGERKKGVMVWFMGRIYPIFPRDTLKDIQARANINDAVLSERGIPLDGEPQTGFLGLQRLCEDPAKLNKGWSELQRALAEEEH